MKIPCFRCGKEIDSPDNTDSDYITADDTIETVIEDGEPKDVVKTAIICPGCYKPDDKIIWGIHTEAARLAIKEKEAWEAAEKKAEDGRRKW